MQGRPGKHCICGTAYRPAGEAPVAVSGAPRRDGGGVSNVRGGSAKRVGDERDGVQQHTTLHLHRRQRQLVPV